MINFNNNGVQNKMMVRIQPADVKEPEPEIDTKPAETTKAEENKETKEPKTATNYGDASTPQYLANMGIKIVSHKPATQAVEETPTTEEVKQPEEVKEENKEEPKKDEAENNESENTETQYCKISFWNKVGGFFSKAGKFLSNVGKWVQKIPFMGDIAKCILTASSVFNGIGNALNPPKNS